MTTAGSAHMSCPTIAATATLSTVSARTTHHGSAATPEFAPATRDGALVGVIALLLDGRRGGVVLWRHGALVVAAGDDLRNSACLLRAGEVLDEIGQ